MPLVHASFVAMVSFLAGVATLLYAENVGGALMLAALCAAAFLVVRVFIYRRHVPRVAGVIACVAVIGGVFYAQTYRILSERGFSVPRDEDIEIVARVVSDPDNADASQVARLEVLHPYAGRILLRTAKYPALEYGDIVEARGVARAPRPEGYAHYLAKDDVYGILAFPKRIEKTGSGGRPLFAALYDIKRSFEQNINSILPPQEAAFLAGILLGERAEFTPEFKEYLRRSGTTHLVALSGYNISIIIMAVSGLLLGIGLGIRASFWVSLAVIAGFVIMTGAQASVVRAGVMGALLLLSGYIGKLHSTRNIITAAAFVMVLINPSILRYDLGFQLSFLALLGIVYVMPAVKNVFHVGTTESLFSWKEQGLTTISAQLMVLPVILGSFGGFSPLSIIANVAVLGLMPLTMGLGFAAGIAGYIWDPLAYVLGWTVHIPLAYETAVISFFGRISPEISFDAVPVAAIILYYLGMAFFVYRYGVFHREK